MFILTDTREAYMYSSFVGNSFLDLCVYIHAVSYTHLDVYKRQVTYFTNFLLIN